MFIKSAPKKDKETGKVYSYYRLCMSYRLGNKVRHRGILSLGDLHELSHYQEFKDLADRIDQLISGNTSLFECANPVVERLAQGFYKQIIEKKLIDQVPVREEEKTLHTVDLASMAIENAREIGGESLCKQALDQLNLRRCLEQAGFADEDLSLAMAHIISRALFPASEHATAEWMKDNSGICELLGIDANKVSHHKLYRISRMLSDQQERIESYLSKKTSELFDLQDKIILYDLTNSYFEGRKLSSILASFAKSKEKRQDCKLITLALVVNVEGFVKYSKIYRGNIGEIATLEPTLDDLSSRGSFTPKKPMVVMDAGIASEENLLMLRNKGYDYLCVARGKFKDYVAVKNNIQPVTITDKRRSPIELTMIEQQGIDDTLLFVRSEKKAKKEVSMHEKFTTHFEEGLQQVMFGIQSKGGTKKLAKVWERIGRLKERYPSAHRFYDIQVASENGIATKLEWKKIIPVSRKEEGVYFLRTSVKQIDEKGFWDIYNTIREIESVFRTLKTDLKMRPVFHKTDENSVAHLNLAVLAYQMVHTIRYQLKAKGINHDWTHIVRIMNTQKAATVTMKDKNDQKIFIRKCTTPEPKAAEIYNALGYKHYPFVKKSVLPENVDRKIEPPGTG
jgi:transposase